MPTLHQFQVGSASVTRITEQILAVPSGYLYPEWSAEAGEQNAHWLGEDHISDDHQTLALSVHAWLVKVAGKPLYEPADIEVPLLLVLGEWDIDVPPEAGMMYFKRAVKAPFKRLVTLGEATHMLVSEKNRKQAFKELSAFLATEIGG